MTKAETILQAGKQIAAIASGRAFRGETLKPDPEVPSNNPAGQRQPVPASTPKTLAEREGMADPGSRNEACHGDQQPGLKKSKEKKSWP